MKINNNIVALRGYNHLTKVNSMKEKSLEKLSTGKRINSASDDAAGMAISTKLNNQIKGLKMAIRNTQDGKSMVETAEQVLGEVTDLLGRMRELCVQASNDTYSDPERDKVATELGVLNEELDRMSEQTKFNGMPLLDGSATGINLQVGANKGETMELDFPAVDSTSLGLDTIDVSDHTNSSNMIDKIDATLESITTDRATLGATMNKLDYTESNLNTMMQSLVAANSRIEDTDVASEMIEFTKNNILAQAGNSMLAQAMQMPNSALQLLQQ